MSSLWEDGEAVKNNYFDGMDGPFVTFLKKLAESTDGAASFEDWLESPSFKVCADRALQLVGGEEELAEGILDGDIPLHEIPKELKANTPERTEWFRGKLQEARDRRTALYGDLSDLLGGEAVEK